MLDTIFATRGILPYGGIKIQLVSKQKKAVHYWTACIYI